MRYLTRQDFTNAYFKDKDPLGGDASTAEKFVALHRYRDEQEGYAYLAKDFHWSMKAFAAESILEEMGLKRVVSVEYVSSLPIQATLWHHPGLVVKGENQGGSWYGHFEFEMNATNAGILPGGGSRRPHILPNGDMIARCHYSSEPGARPLLKELAPYFETSWVAGDIFLKKEQGEFMSHLRSLMRIEELEESPLLIKVVDPDIETLMRQSNMEISGMEDGFHVTNHKGVKRYWKQFPCSRLASYHGGIEKARADHAQEKKIMTMAEAAGANNWERNNNQFQESRHVSFQMDGRCMKGRIKADGEPEIVDYSA